MQEQNREATGYVEAAVAACRKRLGLLERQYQRGIHTLEDCKRLKEATITETEEAWGLSLHDLRER